MPRRERAVLAAGLAAALLFCLGPTANPDLPWHLAVGKRIVETRALPRTDFLSWTQAGRPWMDFEWGTQLLWVGLAEAAGSVGLWAFKAAGNFSLALMLTALLRLQALPTPWIALAAPLYLLALLPSLDIRPEAFSLLFFLFQLYVLERRRLGRLRLSRGALLAGHAAVYALWANLHAGFPTGLLLCGAYAAGEGWRERSRLPEPAFWAAAAVAGTLANPYGVGVYVVLAEHAVRARELHNLIMEWGAPDFANSYLAAYWALVVFAFSGFMISEARGAPLAVEHVVAAAVFAFFFTRALRTTAYATLLLFPLSLPYWYRLKAPPWWRRARPWSLVVIVGFLLWRMGAILRASHLPSATTYIQASEPVRATGFLKREKAVLGPLRMYNPWDWGGWLDYDLFPDYKVFVDGRYIFHDLLAELHAASYDPVRWILFFKKYGVELALMSNDSRMERPGKMGDWRPFDAYALPRERWALVYFDSEALILVRRDKAPPLWLTAREFKILRPRDLRHIGLQIVTGAVQLKDVEAEIERYDREIGDPQEGYLLRQWLADFKKGLGRK